MADIHGRRQTLWVAVLIMASGAGITLSTPLVPKIFGIAIFAFGFFGSHSLVSSWVGHRAIHDKAQASSLYLFFYYVGSSIGGTAGGTLWSEFGWGGVISLILGFLLLAFFLCIRLNSIVPVINSLNRPANHHVHY